MQVFLEKQHTSHINIKTENVKKKEKQKDTIMHT